MNVGVLFQRLNEAAKESVMFRSQGIFSNLPNPVPGRYRVYEDGEWKTKNSFAGNIQWENGQLTLKDAVAVPLSANTENVDNVRVIEKRMKELYETLDAVKEEKASEKNASSGKKRARSEEEELDTEEYSPESDDPESEESETRKRVRSK